MLETGLDAVPVGGGPHILACLGLCEELRQAAVSTEYHVEFRVMQEPAESPQKIRAMTAPDSTRRLYSSVPPQIGHGLGSSTFVESAMMTPPSFTARIVDLRPSDDPPSGTASTWRLSGPVVRQVECG